MDRKVENYLLKGELPAVGSSCQGTADPRPGYGSMRVATAPRSGTNPLLALRQIRELVH